MRLLFDAMLGSLATLARMCGHDAAYALDRGTEADDGLRALARAEDRRLVTRDRALAARTEGAILLGSRDVDDQIDELRAAGVGLSLPGTPARCGRCNGRLDAVATDAALPAYAPDPAETDCYRCRDCGQVFWRGSHWADVRERLGDR